MTIKLKICPNLSFKCPNVSFGVGSIDIAFFILYIKFIDEKGSSSERKMIEKINNILVYKITTYLNVYEKSENSQQKITYFLKVMVDEIEKLIVLLIIFSLLGFLKEYLIVMTTIGSIRSFLGGGHRKTSEGCLLFSFTIIALILVLSKGTYIAYKHMEGIYLLIIILLVKKAPVLTHRSINYTNKKRLEFKFKGMMVLMILSRIIEMISKETANLMLTALLVQGIEVGIECIKKEREVRKNGENI